MAKKTCGQCKGSGFVETKHGPIICPAPGCTHGLVEYTPIKGG